MQNARGKYLEKQHHIENNIKLYVPTNDERLFSMIKSILYV